MSDKVIKNKSEEIVRGTKTVRSSDLSTRERVNFVLSSSLMEALRKKSADEQIPMSRIIDEALKQYLQKDLSVHYEVKLDEGIPLQHMVEILLFISYESKESKNFLDQLKNYFFNYTYSNCLFKLHKQEAFVGTKVLLYLSDSDSKAFNQFLNDISISERYKMCTKIILDHSELQF